MRHVTGVSGWLAPRARLQGASLVANLKQALGQAQALGAVAKAAYSNTTAEARALGTRPGAARR